MRAKLSHHDVNAVASIPQKVDVAYFSFSIHFLVHSIKIESFYLQKQLRNEELLARSVLSSLYCNPFNFFNS